MAWFMTPTFSGKHKITPLFELHLMVSGNQKSFSLLHAAPTTAWLQWLQCRSWPAQTHSTNFICPQPANQPVSQQDLICVQRLYKTGKFIELINYLTWSFVVSEQRLGSVPFRFNHYCRVEVNDDGLQVVRRECEGKLYVVFNKAIALFKHLCSSIVLTRNGWWLMVKDIKL